MYVLLTGPNQEDKDGRGMLQVWGKGRCIQHFGGSLREREHLEDQGVDRRIILKMAFQEVG